MCRLFAQISPEPLGIDNWMQGGARPFVDWSTEHKHGWGIGWYQQGRPHVVKEPKPARESDLFAQTAVSALAPIIIAHLRKATCGEYTEANSQPFQQGNWLFTHNGTVDRPHLLTKLDTRRFHAQGETDSEIYFLWLMQNLQNQGISQLGHALETVRQKDFTALNFVASDGHTVYAYWEQSPTAQSSHPDYYQLYYRQVGGGVRSVVVCSERLDGGDWIRLPERTLLTVTPQVRLETVPIN